MVPFKIPHSFCGSHLSLAYTFAENGRNLLEDLWTRMCLHKSCCSQLLPTLCKCYSLHLLLFQLWNAALLLLHIGTMFIYADFEICSHCPRRLTLLPIEDDVVTCCLWYNVNIGVVVKLSDHVEGHLCFAHCTKVLPLVKFGILVMGIDSSYITRLFINLVLLWLVIAVMAT